VPQAPGASTAPAARSARKQSNSWWLPPIKVAASGSWDQFFTPAFQREQAALLAELSPRLSNQHHDVGILLRYLQARGDWDVSGQLHEVRVPTLVVVGTDDKAANHLEQCRFLAAHIPGATLREIAGARHGFFQERPDETNTILLNWLDQHSGGGD
jgi:3-oxoadipate enol-lactonase/4-carboxymuconolactone decarboxylase